MSLTIKSLRNSKVSDESKVQKVISEVLGNPHLFKPLFDEMLHPDPKVRGLAAEAVDAISLESPSLLQPFKNTLVYKLSKIEQCEVRFHVASMLSRINITSREYPAIVTILASYLSDEDQKIREVALSTVESIVDRTNTAGNDNESFRSDLVVMLKKVSKNGAPQTKKGTARLLSKINEISLANNVA